MSFQNRGRERNSEALNEVNKRSGKSTFVSIRIVTHKAIYIKIIYINIYIYT